MRNIVVYLAASLDGFIAAPGDDLTWLEQVETEGDAGYQQLLDSVDTVMMGRRTYDWICHNATEYPYPSKKSYVVTTTPLHDNHPVAAIPDPFPTLRQIKTQPGKDIWIVGGGLLISSLLNQNLVDQLRVTVSPVLLGSGIQLFPNIQQKIDLKLLG